MVHDQPSRKNGQTSCPDWELIRPTSGQVKFLDGRIGIKSLGALIWSTQFSRVSCGQNMSSIFACRTQCWLEGRYDQISKHFQPFHLNVPFVHATLLVDESWLANKASAPQPVVNMYFVSHIAKQFRASQAGTKKKTQQFIKRNDTVTRLASTKQTSNGLSKGNRRERFLGEKTC